MNRLRAPQTSATEARTGARLLVDALVARGVDICFGVPGESYLAVLDVVRDAPIRFVTCRQEGGAAMMAEAAGKLTGRAGICFVTRGPGATNASAGVHIAQQDSTPMILFVGQVDSAFRHREAFQEIDYRAMFSGLAKWVVEIDDAARVPELVARAFRVAEQGRPGPVVVALPEDMLVATASVADAPVGAPVETHPGAADMQALADLLGAAERPIALLGGSRWSPEAVGMMTAAAEKLELPVAVTFRRQMLFPADHRCFAGHLGIGANLRLVARIKEGDLVLMIGTRMSEMPSQSFSLLGIPDPGVALVHVHADAGELGRVYQPLLAVHASPRAFAPAFAALAGRIDRRWPEWTAAAVAENRAWTGEISKNPGPVQLAEIVAWLSERLPADAIVTNGAGNYAAWVNRFYRYRCYGTQLAPCSGSMGYGLPAAIAAKLIRPQALVVAFAGDGCFQMTMQEFGTAIQHKAAVIVVVVDNGIYGTIRMHQEREYPGRVSATDLVNPDFCALARAYGGHGETVARTEDFAPAFERARAAERPALIHVKLDPEALSPTATISGLRVAALRRA